MKSTNELVNLMEKVAGPGMGVIMPVLGTLAGAAAGGVVAPEEHKPLGTALGGLLAAGAIFSPKVLKLIRERKGINSLENVTNKLDVLPTKSPEQFKGIVEGKEFKEGVQFVEDLTTGKDLGLQKATSSLNKMTETNKKIIDTGNEVIKELEALPTKSTKSTKATNSFERLKGIIDNKLISFGR